MDPVSTGVDHWAKVRDPIGIRTDDDRDQVADWIRDNPATRDHVLRDPGGGAELSPGSTPVETGCIEAKPHTLKGCQNPTSTGKRQ